MNELLSMESTRETFAISLINKVFKLMDKTYWFQSQSNIFVRYWYRVILVKHYRFDLTCL
jgi:hypothetical protein